MFELYQVRYFLAVVETGSFTKAAARTHVSQPTLSAGIAKLETLIGVSLFERRRKRVSLTDAGARFLPRAKAIFGECQQALDDVRTTSPGRKLTLGMLHTLSPKHMTATVRALRAFLPDTVIEVREGTDAALRSAVENRQVHVAITLLRGPSARITIDLGAENYVAALIADHPLAAEPEIPPDELAGVPIIVRSRCEVLSETSRYFTAAGVRPPLAFKTEQDAHAVAMVAAGLGYTVIPESLASAGVACCQLKDFLPPRTLGAVIADNVVERDRGAIASAFGQAWPKHMIENHAI